MKVLIGLLLVSFGGSAMAQYYYKDIVVNRQTIEKWKIFKQNNVKSTKLKSFEANGQPTEGFAGEQKVSNDFTQIATYTSSNTVTSSNLISYYNSTGFLQKTVDTSDTYESITEYSYDAQGRIISIINTALETDNQVKDVEQHLWSYDPNGIPTQMLKIKNVVDTTFIGFIKDEKGNVSEEKAAHHNQTMPTIYYYHDDQNRLTDIVRYNPQAQRMLPDYIFEYDPAGHLVSTLIVREGSSEYQKWVYQYNEKGLESKETCFGNGNELLGRIEYDYKF